MKSYLNLCQCVCLWLYVYVCVYLCCGKLTLTSFSSWWDQTKEEILFLLWFWVLSLFRKKRFMLDEMFYWNVSFAIVFQKYGKVWSISLEHFIMHTPFFLKSVVKPWTAGRLFKYRIKVWFLWHQNFFPVFQSLCTELKTFYPLMCYFSISNPLGNRILVPETTTHKFFGGRLAWFNCNTKISKG